MEEPKENPSEKTKEEIEKQREKRYIERQQKRALEKKWEPRIYVVILINHLVVCMLALGMVPERSRESPDSWWLFILGIGCMANMLTGWVNLNLKHKLLAELEDAEKRIYELCEELNKLKEST